MANLIVVLLLCGAGWWYWNATRGNSPGSGPSPLAPHIPVYPPRIPVYPPHIPVYPPRIPVYPPPVTVIESAAVTGVHRDVSPIKMWTLDLSVDKKDRSLVRSQCLQRCGEQDGICLGGNKSHDPACQDCASYASEECVDRACSEVGRLLCEHSGLCGGNWCPRGPYLCSAAYNEKDPSQPAACYLYNAAGTEEAIAAGQATTVVSPGKALMFTEMPFLLQKSSTLPL